jgi:hypothetical protein
MAARREYSASTQKVSTQKRWQYAVMGISRKSAGRIYGRFVRKGLEALRCGGTPDTPEFFAE